MANTFRSTWHRPFPRTNLARGTLGQEMDPVLGSEGPKKKTSVMKIGYFYDASHFLGPSEGVYMPQSVTQAQTFS